MRRKKSPETSSKGPLNSKKYRIFDSPGCCHRTGKLCHPSRSAAREHLKKLVKRKESYEGMAYECKFCGFWHVGRAKGWRGKR